MDTIRRWLSEGSTTAGAPDLRVQVAAMLNMFFTVRGCSILSNNQTAVVMRAGYETFVTADLREIDDPQTIMAVVALQDIELYSEFKRVQSDNFLRGTTLREMALSRLADQVAEELLAQAKAGSPADKISG